MVWSQGEQCLPKYLHLFGAAKHTRKWPKRVQKFSSENSFKFGMVSNRLAGTTAVGLIPKCWIHYAWLNFYIALLVPSGNLKQATKQQSALVGVRGWWAYQEVGLP